jgi:flavin-binding protein dodecin
MGLLCEAAADMHAFGVCWVVSIAEAAKTVRGLKWARVAELEMELDGKKIARYRTTTKIYFDIEK